MLQAAKHPLARLLSFQYPTIVKALDALTSDQLARIVLQVATRAPGDGSRHNRSCLDDKRLLSYRVLAAFLDQLREIEYLLPCWDVEMSVTTEVEEHYFN